MIQVLLVDDDRIMQKLGQRILSKEYEVLTASSGQEALDILKVQNPELILLDLKMPVMDGFETLENLRRIPAHTDTPVIMLTGDSSKESEIQALSTGVLDFIHKPFIAEALMLRVANTIELYRLRKNLAVEVERKTAEVMESERKVRSMALEIVQTLSGTIDAKDEYTNGHSQRVAFYSREIARRFGYTPEDQMSIYLIGLLHDIGKIGIPDEIIRMPRKLTDAEYEVIKKHPTIGANILRSVKSIPNIAAGAHWHHERYDGKGYPDGLKGEEIPEVARIIAVADAYDAMTSNRSYRKYMPQEVVRGEIERGIGTQFDPTFAKIMLQMIDEDKEYTMQEQGKASYLF